MKEYHKKKLQLDLIRDVAMIGGIILNSVIIYALVLTK